MVLSPLHTREMDLFDAIYDEYHQCAVENLYYSAAFCRAYYNHMFTLLCHGGTIKRFLGLPPSVL